MAQFEVDFSESLSQLAQFQLRLANMGKALDTLEAKSGKSTSASTKLLATMNAEYDKLEKILVASGADAEKLGKTMQTVRDNVNLMMSGLAANNLKATVQAKAYNGELAELGRLLNDTASKNTYSAWQQKTLQLTNKMTAENSFLRAAIAATDSEVGKSNANLKANLAHKQNMATVEQRLRITGDNLTLTLAGMTSGQGKSNVMTQAYIAARRSQITEEFRLDNQLRQLEKTLAGLTGGQQEQITKTQQLIAARKAEITETAREDLQLKKLQATLASLTGGRQEEIARVNAQIAARKKAITEATIEKKVVDEMTAAIKREEAALVRLQAQAQLASTSHGQRVTQLKTQIAEQERHNKLLGMSTSALLGFGAAQTRVNVAQELGSQSAAMLRAGLTGLHASVGMYTSATVLAATATYGISAALRDSVITGAEFYATMSRTRAVMSGGEDSAPWLTNAQEQSRALEMQVRALGQTTVFTASEVGDGLQQLGMAGLSANEALVALKPALQLANLANVDMGRSADIATNVLMTFGMQAKDLQGVVDLMATAVNNSNADIEQLANSLSYAGPAAKTAGFSIQETTAAIETMANVGIKGSRSGSALRRMFTNLLNPTKQGSEVIKKYSLDILDAEGNTRSLSNIINQMSRAFKDLPGPERLAAITDLVGVYASSAVTGLVDNTAQFNEFSAQNQNVAGAGDRMEKIISDNLKFDWKEMLSSLEEVQLQAFSQLDMRLREMTANATKYVLDLMEPYREGTDITSLERLMVQAQTSAEAIARVLGGVAAYKIATGSVFGALSVDAKGASERLTLVSERLAATSAGMTQMSLTTGNATTAFRVQAAASVMAANGLTTLGTGAAWAASRLSIMAAAAGAVMRALGWVGLIYGIGSAIYSVFSTDTDEEVLNHRNSIDDVKSSYDQLKKSIEETGLARQRAALKEQLESNKLGVGDVQGRINSRTALLQQGVAAGLPEESLKPVRDELDGLQAMLGTFEARVKESQVSLDGLGKTTNDYVDEGQAHANRLAELVKLTNDLAIAQTNLSISLAQGGGDFGAGAAGSQAMVDALTKRRNELMAAAQGSANNVQQTRANLPTTEAQLGKIQADLRAQADAKNYEKITPLAQQLLDNEKAITAEKENQRQLIEKGAAAVAANDMAARPGLQQLESSAKTMAQLESDREVLLTKLKDDEQKLAEAKRASALVTMSETENLAAQKKQLEAIRAEIQAAEAPGEGKAADTKNLTRLYGEQAKILGQIKSMEGKSTKAAGRSDKTAERQAEEDLRAYTALAKKFDEASYAQLDLAKGTEAMRRLRAAGTITMEQEDKALGELNLKYYQAVNALDKQHTALEKLRDGYSQSPFGIAANDLAVLNDNLQRGTISLEEFNRIYMQIREKQLDQATSGLPTAGLTTGDASSSPFTDLVSTVVEASDGNKAYEKRQLELEKSLEIQLAANERERQLQTEQLNAKQLEQQAHADEMLRIEKTYQDQKSAIQRTAGEQQGAVATQYAKYQEEMGKMALIGAMASAGNILGMFASAAEDASAAQKIAFVAQKALAVAQIIMYTELAAARATGEMPFGMGIGLATFIRATGYANAGLVAGLAIGQLAGGSSSGGGGGGGGMTMYDTGGFIPYNRTGIVGEYGPELVSGPAHVTGRGNSASKLASQSGGGNNYEIVLAPVIQMAPGTGGGDAGETRQILDTVKTVVVSTMKDMIRPQGMLDNWLRSTRDN